MLASILLRDGEQLIAGAAPSLPAEYTQALNGVPIRPYIGPCGKAALHGQMVVSSDLQQDGEWSGEFRALARQYGLSACWSSPIRSGHGQVVGTFAMYKRQPASPTPNDTELIGVATHIAGIAIQRARAEERERVLRQTAEDANRAKAEFLAVMSHELRTPLNAILGYVDLLLMGVPEGLSPGAQQKLERVAGSTRHLLQLIEQILTFSRIEAGREDVQLETVDFARLIRDTAMLVQPLAERKGLRFELRVSDAVSRVTTDAGKVRQILLNLLSNAIKFTESGTIELSADCDAGGGVRLSVRDTGAGIAPELHQQIFEPFRQVESDRTRRADGVGLGLAVSQRLADLLGGRIQLESAPGQGSHFSLWLSGSEASNVATMEHRLRTANTVAPAASTP